MSNFTDYTENKILDLLLRGQAFAPPSSLHIGLFTSSPSDAGGGTEVNSASTGYGRASVTASLANWSGTQGVGTTTASTGTSGRSSNNNVITFPNPTANWGVITHMAVFDAPTGGNMLFYSPLVVPKTVNNGDPGPTIAADGLSLTLA